MKKAAFIGYTLAILMLGGLIGGGVAAWALGTAARVAYGPYQVGMTYQDENRVLIQIYNPKSINRVEQMGSHRVNIILK